MRLKSFYGPTMTEAMRLVREALGDDAIIVATRDDEMGGVRVTAAIDDPVEITKVAPIKAPPQNDGSESIEVIASALVSHRIAPALSERILATATQVANDDPLLSLGAGLDTHFEFATLSDGFAPRPLLLIGPPGAGKTLTVAKLATKAKMDRKKIAVISTDTERAGGMAQLGAFTRVLETDLIEIEDSHALHDAVAMQTPDTITLIDTPGCNPLSEQDRLYLASLIKASGGEPVLVMPADQDASEATESARVFADLGAMRFLFTRLDMTRRVGNLLLTAYESKIPMASFSASGKVTQPPQPLNPVSLARLILPKGVAKSNQATGTH